MKKIKYNTEEYIKIIKEIHGEKFIYDNVKYTKMQDNVELICKKHNISFYRKAYLIIQGKIACPLCNKTKKHTNETLDVEITKIHGDTIKRLGDVKGQHKKIDFMCMSCEHIWFAKPNNILSRKSKCPKCQRKKLEELHSQKWKTDLVYKNKILEGIQKNYGAGSQKRKDAAIKFKNWPGYKIHMEKLYKIYKEYVSNPLNIAKLSENRKKQIVCGNITPGGYRNTKKQYILDYYCQSSYEKNFILYCIKNNILFEWQKIRIPYIVDNIKHIYIIDAVIGNTIIEIKADSLLDESSYTTEKSKQEYKKLKEKIIAANVFAKENNMIYEIWTEKTHPWLETGIIPDINVI